MCGKQLCAFTLFKFLLSAMTRMAGEQLGRKKSWNEGIRNDRNDRKAETTGMTVNPKRQE
jgi:hypothetical protein